MTKWSYYNKGMKTQITKKQKKVLELIYKNIQSSGFPPTLANLRTSLKLASNQAVLNYLNTLERKKFIRREEGQARAIKITNSGFKVLSKDKLAPMLGISSAGPYVESFSDTFRNWVTLPSKIMENEKINFSENVFIIQVFGDSMTGADIDDGDILLAQKTAQFKTGDIVVARNDEGTTIKRFIIEPSGKKYLRPENPSYKNLTIDRNTYFDGRIILNLTKLEKSYKKTIDLKFIDFCSGIGAGRLGLQNLGLKCAGFSEIDKNSEKTYREFFGHDEKNYGDLMKIDPSVLPNFDIMVAGFPCQSFSVIGQRRGMKDSRGQIIYGLIRIMKEKNLPYFILENVKGLVNHEGGKSLEIILGELDAAGYKVYHKVLNSIDYGVPQMRERIYFVGIRKDLVKKDEPFKWPKPVKIPQIEDYLVDDGKLEFDEKKRSYETFLKFINNKYNKGLFKIEKLLKEEHLVLDTRQSDLRLYRMRVPTLRTGRHGVLYVKNGKFRKLSGYESLLLQGFPDEMAKRVKGKISDMYLLSQAGNAMTVNVIEAIGRNLLKYIKE
jgi:DNA (cytosine-5)-methyltransferase 1